MFGNKEKKKDDLSEDMIMRKGNIFQARKGLIYICHILNKEINLDIRNGPVKDSRAKKGRRSAFKKD